MNARRLILWIVPVALLAQKPAPPSKPEPGQAAEEAQPVIQVDVDIVNVMFSVRDKKNTLVGNLDKDDFTVKEDGKEQTIKYFARESDLPLTLGVLVDVSKSQENLIEIEKRAADQFFQQVLRQKDMAFLISFGAETELLQDLTNSPKLLRRGLDELRLNAGAGGIHPSPVPTSSKPRGTLLHEAVYLASNEKLRREVGRKAIIVITDGVDQGSRVSLNEAIEAAHKADAIIYSIYYVDPGFYGGFFGGDGALKKMSEETGGRVFEVRRRNTLPDIFRQIQEEMRSQYAIGYTSTNPDRDGGFRKIEIRTQNRDLKVQARKGYYAQKPEKQ
jgi:VWFA-related protein